MKKIILLFCLLFAITAAPVWADDPPASQQPYYKSVLDNVAAQNSGSFFDWAQSTALKALGINFDFNKTITENLMQMSGVKDSVAGLIEQASPWDDARAAARNLSTGPAVQLAAILSVIYLVLSGMRMVAGDGFSALTDAFLEITFFMALVMSYDTVFGELLPKFFDSWANAIYSATSGNAGGTVAQAAGGLVEAMFTFIGHAVVATLENIVSYFFMFTILFILFTGPALYKLGMATITVIATFLIANGAAAIGLIVGPICLGFGVLPFTRKIMWSWLGLLTGALGIKVAVAAAMPVFVYFAHMIGTTTGLVGSSAWKDTILIMVLAQVMVAIVDLIPDAASTIFGGMAGSFKSHNAAESAVNTAARVGLKVASKGML